MSEGGSAEASGERSVAAGGDIGSVSTGDFVTQVARATVLPAEAIEFTGRVCHLPERTRQFVGRERELALLDEAFTGPGGVVVHAVHGLGGIGKSTLAAQWAAGRADDFNPVWWITAESRTNVDAGISALGRALQPALVGVLTEEAIRERTLQWLSSHDGWLIVLDNVSDPADIVPLLARAPGGRFLITTRRGATSWRGIAEPLDLDVLEPDEAVELFTRIYGGPARGAAELCAELGGLPLAVDQAAAYCREAGITPLAYLKLLERYPADMYAATAEGGDAQRAVARVWRVTLNRLADNPDISTILLITAWWAPDGIPRAYLASLGSPLQVTEALRRLAAHSMIRLHGDTISVHRMVQAVARTPELPDSRRSTRLVEVSRKLAVALLAELGPMIEMDDETKGAAAPDAAAQEAGRVWLTHVDALASRSAPETDTLTAAELFSAAGLWYGLHGDAARGVALCERALSAALRICGPDDEMTREFRDILRTAKEAARELSLVSRALDDDREAIDFIEQRAAAGDDEASVADIEDQLAHAVGTLGERHPTVVDLRMQLAFARGRVGDVDGALRLTEEVVPEMRRIYGETATITLAVRVRHVMSLRKAGDEARAQALVPDLMADIEQSLGDSLYARVLRRGLHPRPPADPD